MKNTFLSILIILCQPFWLNAQLNNPSFEENGQPSLEGWLDYYCDFATSENDAPPNAGQWCVKMQPGQTQGCFPGYFYQILPTVTNGQIFHLEGWAKIDSEGPLAGIFLGRKDAEGTIFLFDGDTTSSENWTMLSVVDTFVLEPGDVAVVVLNSGLVGGPIGPSQSSYFDNLQLNLATSVSETYFKELKIYPNPIVNSTLFIELDPIKTPIDDLSLFDVTGKLVFKHPGYQKTIDVNNWPSGIYCLKLKSGKNSIVKKIVIN